MDLLETIEEPLKAVAFEGEVVVSGSVCLAMTPEAALASADALRKAAEATLGERDSRRPQEPRSWAAGDTEGLAR